MKSFSLDKMEYSIDMHHFIYYVTRNITALLSILGNYIVLRAIIKFKSLETATDLFIFNLAICDLLSGLIVSPFSTAVYYLKPTNLVALDDNNSTNSNELDN